jgi:hypothetical protein
MAPRKNSRKTASAALKKQSTAQKEQEAARKKEVAAEKARERVEAAAWAVSSGESTRSGRSTKRTVHFDSPPRPKKSTKPTSSFTTSSRTSLDDVDHD